MTGTVTPPTLSQARNTVNTALTGGTIRNPITHDDVLKAVQAIAALPPAQAKTLMAELAANGKLEILAREAMDGKSFSLGGLSAGERQTYFSAMAKALDGASLARLGSSFDAADNGANGYHAAQDMARAVATFGTAQVKLDYIKALATKSTDNGTVNSSGIGGTVMIQSDAEASAIGTILSSMRGANADRAFSSLSQDQIAAVLNSGVSSTVRVSGGLVMTGASVTANWNPSGFTNIMKAAQSVTNPDTRVAIMQAATTEYMNVLTAKNSLGYTVIGQPQTLNTMRTAITGFSGGAKLPEATNAVSREDLALDVLQISLDVIGIIEPTPFADATNAVISLGRGDLLGAVLSGVGIVPYLGDLAKAGKLGKWASTIEKAIDLAKTDSAFAAMVRPALEKLHYALDKMGDAMPDALKGMKTKLDEFLAIGGRALSDGVVAAAERLGIPPGKVQDLLDIKSADGILPDPSTYMSADRIAAHLDLFKSGAVRIQPSAPSGTIGRSETWVMPKALVDDAIAKANGDPRKLEQLLGLDSGYLGAHPMLVDIPVPNGARIPTGNEYGANDFWRPGGYTHPGGIPEVIIDPVPAGSYTTKPVF